ncbi:hypothetical protein MW887_006774 [Aspergillus wentii]|nr:hypothetical protein MW887_006774 [Aspergillus wentii]
MEYIVSTPLPWWLTVSITALRWGPERSGIPEVPSGLKPSSSSPPLDHAIALSAGSNWPSNILPEYKGEAAHTIPGECERLFCDRLFAVFLGERRLVRQASLGVNAHQVTRPNYTAPECKRIQEWAELWDYTGDTIYRGFVTSMSGERTLFVFFAEDTLGHSLKTGLIALFELASISNFDCSQIVACIRRSQDTAELEAVRNLGWCGFSLTTLKPWITDNDDEFSLSEKWLFLSAEV